MKLFADTADLRELKELDEMGLICGITTNPTIASQTGKNLVDVLANIAKEFPEIPVFGQVVAKDTEGMVAEARKIVTAGKNIVVKLPATREAVKAIKILHAEGIKTCATAVLTASQGFLCATAGADYVAPYTGQNDVIGYDGLVTLEQLCDVSHEEGLPTEVLAASIEKPQEIVEYALAGADIVTMPYHVFTDTFDSPLPLTKYYVDRFYKDWSGAGCVIEGK